MGASRARGGLSGAAVIRRKFKRIQEVAFEALESELIEQAQIVLSKANDRAPVDTEDMINDSLVTSDSSLREKRIRVVVAYVQRYAVFQHELFFNPGPKTEEKLGSAAFGAGRKWLEKVYRNREKTIIAASGKRVARALRTVLR